MIVQILERPVCGILQRKVVNKQAVLNFKIAKDVLLTYPNLMNKFINYVDGILSIISVFLLVIHLNSHQKLVIYKPNILIDG